MIRCAYPGRACLLGEHCDWYGGASLAVPLPMAVEAAARPGPHAISIETTLDGRPAAGAWAHPAVEPAGGPLRFVPAAAWHLQQQGMSLPPTHLTVRSDLPTGRGFSSSAAFCLAVLDALAQSAGHALSAQALAEHAFTVENTLLGVACGRLDQHACAAREPVFFEWQGGHAVPEAVHVGAPMVLVVGAFSAPRDTPGILAALRRGGPAVDAALSVFAETTRRGRRALEAGDTAGLGAAMNDAQEAYASHLLALPELAAPQLLRACAALRAAGARGAKFSGAGGDGSVIALFDDVERARAARAKLEAGWLVPLRGGRGRPS